MSRASLAKRTMDIATVYGRDFNLSGGDQPERITGERASWNYFRVLRITPILGRSFLEEEERIDLTRIQRELWRQEKQDVDLETIKDVLIKLSRGDLLDYKPFGGWFSKINDPILEEFLKVWGRIEVVGINARVAREETVTLVVQVNGKVRDRIEVPAGLDDDRLKETALASDRIQNWMDGKSPRKVIVVRGKLVNIVV